MLKKVALVAALSTFLSALPMAQSGAGKPRYILLPYECTNTKVAFQVVQRVTSHSVQRSQFAARVEFRGRNRGNRAAGADYAAPIVTETESEQYCRVAYLAPAAALEIGFRQVDVEIVRKACEIAERSGQRIDISSILDEIVFALQDGYDRVRTSYAVLSAVAGGAVAGAILYAEFRHPPYQEPWVAGVAASLAMTMGIAGAFLAYNGTPADIACTQAMKMCLYMAIQSRATRIGRARNVHGIETWLMPLLSSEAQQTLRQKLGQVQAV